MLAGCGYRFTADSGTRLPAGQRVWVAYFQNSTVHPNATVALKRALFDQFAALRGLLPAVAPDAADLVVSGRLTGYDATVVSYTAADTAKEYRLTLTAEVTVRRRNGAGHDQPPLWKGTVAAWQDYPVTATIEMQRSGEDAAVVAAARKLAQQVVWNLEQAY